MTRVSDDDGDRGGGDGGDGGGGDGDDDDGGNGDVGDDVDGGLEEDRRRTGAGSEKDWVPVLLIPQTGFACRGSGGF